MKTITSAHPADADNDLWRDGPAVIVHSNRELSDIAVNQATLEELQIAYRALRDHHTAGQTLLTSADAIMRRDEETIDHLSAENARLSEIIDFMQNHYSPLGGRGCALCVYKGGCFIRPCAIHRWETELR